MKQFSLSLTCFFVATIAWAGPADPQKSLEEPRQKAPAMLKAAGDDPQPPVWVSAEAATRDSGQIDWDLLGESAHQNYLGVLRMTPPLLAKPPGDHSAPQYDPNSSGVRPDCVYYGASYYDSPGRPSDRTLQDVFQNARTIARGRIIEMTPGFFQGEPSTLLTIEIERVLRDAVDSEVLHVVYPYARFTIGGVNFCKGDTEFPYRPQTGDRSLVMSFREPRDKGGSLYLVSPQELIFETASGSLVLPQRFAASSDRPAFDRLEDLERRLIEKN